MGMPSLGAVNDAYSKMFEKVEVESKRLLTERRENLTEEEKTIEDMKDSLHMYGKVHEVIAGLDNMLTNEGTNDNKYLERLHKFVKAMEGKISNQFDKLSNDITAKKDDEGINSISNKDLYNLGAGSEYDISSKILGSGEFANKLKAYLQKGTSMAREYYDKTGFIQHIRDEHPSLKQSQIKKLADIIYN